MAIPRVGSTAGKYTLTQRLDFGWEEDEGEYGPTFGIRLGEEDAQIHLLLEWWPADPPAWDALSVGDDTTDAQLAAMPGVWNLAIWDERTNHLSETVQVGTGLAKDVKKMLPAATRLAVEALADLIGPNRAWIDQSHLKE